MSDYIQTIGQESVDKINEQIASILIDTIDKHINLDKIISDDLENRFKVFQEAYNSCKDEDIKSAMQEPKIEFNSIKDKLDYSYQALISKGLIITHDIKQQGLLTVRIYKEELIKHYLIESSNTCTVKEV